MTNSSSEQRGILPSLTGFLKDKKDTWLIKLVVIKAICVHTIPDTFLCWQLSSIIWTPICDSPTYLGIGVAHSEILYRNYAQNLDYKTVRIFAYSNTREQSNKRSETRLKPESETGERRCTRVRLLRHVFLISLLILQSNRNLIRWNRCSYVWREALVSGMVFAPAQKLPGMVWL